METILKATIKCHKKMEKDFMCGMVRIANIRVNLEKICCKVRRNCTFQTDNFILVK